jgi:hypothetical protein
MQNYQNNRSSTVEQVDMYRFQTMYKNVLKPLRNDIDNIKNNNLDALTTFKSTDYTSITGLDSSSFLANAYNTQKIISLNGYTRDPFNFIEYRNLFTDLVQGIDVVKRLNVSTIQQLKETITTLESERSKFTTLTSLMNASLNVNIYTDVNVNLTATELLPWYAEYLFLYGPPSNGVFDIAKLNAIIDRQILSGLYTIEEYLTSDKYINYIL